MDYPALVPGYLGTPRRASSARSPQTLNARFYGELWRLRERCSPGADFFSERLPFPQRIPKTGFFDELFPRGPQATAFRRCRALLRRDWEKAYRQIGTNPTRALNLTHWLLRWDALPDRLPPARGVDTATRFELAHLGNLARLGRSLSADRPAAGRVAMATLAERALGTLSPVAAVPFVTMFVVSSFRYPAPPSLRDRANDAARALENVLENEEPRTFLERLHFAVAHRGVAMAGLPKKRKGWHLEQALAVSCSLAPTSLLENFVADENLLTLRQTLSKWALATGDVRGAEAHLDAMVALDRYDSTAHSERGLFLLAEERFAEAERAFRRAAILGPPAVGMNRFFEGLCLKHRGRLAPAEKAFEEAIRRDPLALSPHLELLGLPSRKAGTPARRRAVAHVLRTPVLRRQLTALERKELRHE